MKNPMDENEMKNVFDEQDIQPEDQNAAPDPTENIQPSDPVSDQQPEPKPKKKKNKALVITLAVIVTLLVLAAIALVVYFAVIRPAIDKQEEPVVNDESNTEIVLNGSDYFVAENPYEQVVYTPDMTYDLEGDILDVFAEKSLAAVVVTDLDVYNYDVDTVQIVDLLTGNVILNKSVKNLRNDPITKRITAEFCDECGIITITETTITDPGLETEKTDTVVYHYTAKLAPELLGVSINDTHECKDLGDVYAIAIEKKITFFDEEMNYISDKNGDFLEVDDIPYLSADSYMVSETEGYFYFFSDREALVFDINGTCTAKYTLEHVNALSLKPFVLNNGKLFLQAFTVVDPESKKYDVRLFNSLIDVKSYIMDNVTGNIQEIECDFAVEDLSPAYESDPIDKGFPLYLKEGRQNQAYISYFADGKVTPYTEYVVLDNSLNVQYTFPRTGSNIDYERSYTVDENHIIASLVLGGEARQYVLLDLSGNFISAFPNVPCGVTDSFIVSNQIIYDHNMKEIYNFASKGYAFAGTTGDNVYLYIRNEATRETEFYVYNNSTEEPKLAADGIELDYDGKSSFDRDYSISRDDRGWKIVSNCNGDVIAMSDGYLNLVPVEGAMIVTTTIKGEIRNYVIHGFTAEE